MKIIEMLEEFTEWMKDIEAKMKELDKWADDIDSRLCEVRIKHKMSPHVRGKTIEKSV